MSHLTRLQLPVILDNLQQVRATSCPRFGAYILCALAVPHTVNRLVIVFGVCSFSPCGSSWTSCCCCWSLPSGSSSSFGSGVLHLVEYSSRSVERSSSLNAAGFSGQPFRLFFLLFFFLDDSWTWFAGFLLWVCDVVLLRTVLPSGSAVCSPH